MDSLQKIRTFSGFVPARSVQGNTSHFAIGNQGTFAGHGAAHRVLDVGHAVDVISIEPAALIADNVGLHPEARSQMTPPKKTKECIDSYFLCASFRSNIPQQSSLVMVSPSRITSMQFMVCWVSFLAQSSEVWKRQVPMGYNHWIGLSLPIFGGFPMPGIWKMAVHEENMMNVSDLPTVQRFFQKLNTH